MRLRTLLLVLLGAWLYSAGCFAGELQSRPNILYFYVDDMGWGSIGPNGQAARRAKGLPYVRTPNLDRLAAYGVNFTRGYGCHVCSPARSSQQSGFHQGHTFADRNDPNNAKKAMRANDILIGDTLSSAGYVTGYWGKWGYGGSQDRVAPKIVNVQTLPTAHGYQHVLAELHHVRAHTFFQPTLWHAPAQTPVAGGLELVSNSIAAYNDAAAFPLTPAHQNHPEYPDIAYCDDAYAFAALDFVRSQGQNYNATGQPFFGLLAVQIPHAPFGEIASLPNWDLAYKDAPNFNGLSEQTRQWAAMVTRIDAHFGNILDALEDPNHDGDTSDSIAANTLVIFQSDNGGPGGPSHRELDTNGGLRGTKGQIQEGGIRVPLIMRWPSKIQVDSSLRAGSNCDRVVDVTDLLPTFCELAGAEIPLGIDGVSLAPTLTGTGHQRRREFVIHEAGNGQSIICGNYKLVRAKARRQKYRLELYQLDTDPAEQHNVAAENPELVQQLEELLLEERVAEPKGFANTYHHWIGQDEARASDPNHWSDYVYANDGVTYMRDEGAPQLSWIAHMHNTAGVPQSALADADLRFLGLEVRGHGSTGAPQTLKLQPGIDLIGRNEIRIAAHGQLVIDGGRVTSQRWIDIHQQAELAGTGVIDCTLFNAGKVSITSGPNAQLHVLKDYHQSAEAELEVKLSGRSQPSLVVEQVARLAGRLRVSLSEDLPVERGESIILLAADHIAGRFDHPGEEVVTADGTRFTLSYSASTVSLTRKP